MNASRWILLATLLASSGASANEPNETFFTSTVLAPGVLSVSDELTPGLAPDTIVGGFGGFFGDLIAFNNNSNAAGNGRGSAIFDVDLNNGAVDFSVSGFGDNEFFGSHQEVGGFEATVTVYDFFGDEVDEFTVEGFLQPGVVESYRFDRLPPLSDFYDVVVDNTALQVADVDFFTFTGLEAGADFVVETQDPFGFAVDTFLGWFGAGGVLLDSDEDGGAELLSRIAGVVPDSGELTFGVTGFGDTGFQGAHNQDAFYDLVLAVESPGLEGDFNDDLAVDAADYTVWRDGLAAGDFTQADLQAWVDNYGATASAAAAPEPTASLLAVGLVVGALLKRR